MPPTDAPSRTEDFYDTVPVFRGFTGVVDPAQYQPLPDDWWIGVADVEDSTVAVAAKRYKAVNMAGAAVIVSITNALEHRDFPFVFGGDGASFAVPASAAALARDALAATAAWVKEDLDLSLRVALVPVAAVRASGANILVARFAPSDNVSLAMFSGGGLALADAAMKRGEFAVTPAPPGTHPDLSGLSCRFEEIPATHGLIVSLLVTPAPGAGAEAFRGVVEGIVRLMDRSPDASGPVPQECPKLKWPPQGLDLEARAQRRPGESLRLRKAKLLGWTLVYFLIMRLGIKVGAFSPQKYSKEVVENSDFRKFDDGLRMVIDCTHSLADQIEAMLSQAAAAGTVRFGLHRQDKAMMTCFTPSPVKANHVHFIDGALGGYTTAASALKASARD